MIIERKLSAADNEEAWSLQNFIINLQSSVHQNAAEGLQFLDQGQFIEAKGRLLIAAELCGAIQSESSQARQRILAMDECSDVFPSTFTL